MNSDPVYLDSMKSPRPLYVCDRCGAEGEQPTHRPDCAATKRNLSLTVTVDKERGQLLVAIGIDTLAEAYHRCEDNNPFDESTNDFRQEFRVVDPVAFAVGVAHGLEREAEDGSTPLTRTLDAACWDAVESACGVEECEEARRG